jgi:glutaredoxin
MKTRKVRLFIKPFCPWCDEATDWLDEHGVRYQRLDVIADDAAWQEMVKLSDQTKAPVIDVDGEVLADFGAAELEAWWRKQDLDRGSN